MTNYLDASEIEQLLDTMCEQIRRMYGTELQDVQMIGLETGGLWIARRLHSMLALASELGSINIHFYRDDFSRIGLHPKVGPSHVPESLEDKQVLLIDDVFYTGRTVRAALNEIFDYGRAAEVRLAVLIDRGGHELPIQPDIVGQIIELPTGRQVKLTGPEPLALKMLETA